VGKRRTELSYVGSFVARPNPSPFDPERGVPGIDVLVVGCGNTRCRHKFPTLLEGSATSGKDFL
jgi:hypothetical protein